MRKIYILIIAISASLLSHGQTNYINVCVDCNNLFHSFDFNSSTDSTNFFFTIDTTQMNNLWQVGTPTKSVFNSGFVGPKAFVTDTMNSYPTNNISSFQFSMVNCSWTTYGSCGGSYTALWMFIATKINSDASKDGGTIEISHNGSQWVNIIKDSLASISGDIYSINDTVQSMSKPGYSGVDNNWKQMNISFAPEMSALFDTITFRFTFTSDSIQTYKDGWMIGMIQVGGMFENIPEIISSNLISVFPNPATNELIILPNGKKNLKGEISIIDVQGKQIFNDKNFSSNTLNISNLNSGLYTLKYNDGTNYSTLKFIKK